MLAQFAAAFARRSDAQSWGSLGRMTAAAALTAAAILSVSGAVPASAAVVNPNTSSSAVGSLGSELVGERTRSSRTFLRIGGTATDRITRVYAGSVNYRGRSGDWLPIDNALISATGGYRNKASWFDVELPARLAGEEVAVSEDGDRVAFSLRGADASGVTDGSTIEYREAFPDVDVRYEVDADWLKELVVLKSSKARRSFVFDLKLSKGLVPELSHGAVVLRDRGGEARMSLAAPFMTDAAGAETRAVRFGLAKAGDVWQLTMTADNAWLDEASRAWPVQIDPQVFPGAQADCTIDQASPWTNYCGASTLSVGGASTSQKRSVLRFDIAGAVPFGSAVTSAALGMKLQSQTISQAMTVKLHRLNTDYFSGATWNTPWSSPGGDFPSTADCQSCPLVGGSATGGGTQPGSYAYWWIPALVEGWANGTINNRGMVLKPDALTANGNVVSFASNEAPSGSQPFIDTTYQPPARVGNYPQSRFETQSLTERSEISVNVVEGNLLLSNSDLRIAGTGLELAVARYYNGLSQNTGSLGKAWKMGLGQDVELYVAANSATVRAPSGELVKFTRNVDGTYTSPLGLHATLAWFPGTPACEDGGCSGEGPHYALTDHATGAELRFTAGSGDSLQRLYAQSDRYGNMIRFTYNTANKLTAITDTQNRVVTVTQNNGRIERLTDWTGRFVQYGYDAQGRLATYTDAESKPTTYGYDSAGLLAAITTPGGRVTKFTYDVQGRVKTIVRTTDTAHTTGPTTRFDYSVGAPCGTGQTKTIVSDPEAATAPGHTVTYCGDTSGRVVRTVNSSGHTTSLTYGATGDLASVTLPGGGVTNYGYDSTTRNLLCVQRAVTVVQSCQAATGGLKTSLTYGGADELTKYFPTAITNPQGNTTTYCYNGSTPACGSNSGPPGSLQTITNGLAAQSARRFGYFSRGNIAFSTDARGNSTTYEYDGGGNLTTVTPPYQVFVQAFSSRVGRTTIVPDALSRLATVTDSKNQSTTYSYDKLDRTKQIDYRPAGSTTPERTILRTFDSDGPVRTLTDPTGVTTYSVDDLLRLKREAFASNGTLLSYTHVYDYDNANNLKTLTDGSGTTTYTYNGLNQLSAMREPLDAEEPSAQDTLFSYNSDGARTQIKYASGVTVNWGYDIPSGRITSVVNRRPTGDVLMSKTYAYTYRADHPLSGRDTELPQTITDEGGYVTKNTYDALDRLTLAVTTRTPDGPNESYFAFTFDGDGNRTSSTINKNDSTPPAIQATTTWAYDEINLPCWRAGWTNPPDGGAYTCRDEPDFGKAKVRTLTHDANGNDIDNRHQAFSYNAANQPAVVTADTTDGSTVFRPVVPAPLAYRGAGQSQLVKDGPATVQQNLLGIGVRGTGTTYYPRAADGTLISQRTPTRAKRRNYLYDADGSVIGLTDRDGALTTTYRYDPYGYPQNKYSTGDENPFGYGGGYMAGLGTDGVMCGGVYIGEVGLLFDPEDGRYTALAMSSFAGAIAAVNEDKYFGVGRRARQQAANGMGFTGAARETFLESARSDPSVAARAARLAEYYNPTPKPDRAVGIDDILRAVTQRPVLEAVGGCIGGGAAGGQYGGYFAMPVAGAATGCVLGGAVAPFGGNLSEPWRSGQP